MAEKEQFKLLYNLNISIETAAYLDVGREWEKMVESFAYYRLYYVRFGSGKIVLTNKTIELEEGYMYFIPAFSILGGTCNSLGHYFIHMIPDATTAHLLKILALKEKCPLEKPIADYLFTTIAQNSKKDTLMHAFSADSALKFLLSRLIDENASLSANEFDTRRFLPVLEYIEQNITEKIRVSNLAELIYLDEGYFSNLFKATFGVSVKQYIMDKKIERAKTMLIADTPTSIVAETLNFYDTASFSNYFKKKTGLTPKEFHFKSD